MLDGDVIYGGHGLMITGYKQYSSTLRIGGGITVPVDIFSVSVYDGWSATERWYDIEQLSMYPFSGDYRATGITVATYNML